jgi:hypothetical protein
LNCNAAVLRDAKHPAYRFLKAVESVSYPIIGTLEAGSIFF